jgi:hypothetical protein
MGSSVEVEFIGESYEIKSVSPHVLKIVQGAVIDHKKELVEFNSEYLKKRQELAKERLGERLADIQDVVERRASAKDDPETTKEELTNLDEEFQKIISETGIDALTDVTVADHRNKIDLMDLESRFTAKIIQIILLDMTRPDWKDRRDKPTQSMLNDIVTVEKIMKFSSIAEMNTIIDVFYQLNSVETMVGNAGRLANLI